MRENAQSGPARETADPCLRFWQESALPVVELLLRRPEAGEWLRAKNRAGQLPLDCVEKSKKSASAKVCPMPEHACPGAHAQRPP